MKQIEQYENCTRFNFDNGWSVRAAFYGGLVSVSERKTKRCFHRVWKNWQQVGADAFVDYLSEVSHREPLYKQD